MDQDRDRPYRDDDIGRLRRAVEVFRMLRDAGFIAPPDRAPPARRPLSERVERYVEALGEEGRFSAAALPDPPERASNPLLRAIERVVPPGLRITSPGRLPPVDAGAARDQVRAVAFVLAASGIAAASFVAMVAAQYAFVAGGLPQLVVLLAPATLLIGAGALVSVSRLVGSERPRA